MRYIDQSLAAGETIIQRGKWPGIFWFGAWAALLVLGIAIVGVFIFVWAAVKMLSTDFGVTDRRVILKTGWLNRHTQELSVETVEGVNLDQSLFARIFGYGRVIVTGTGEARIAFPPMAHPVAFRRSIEAARAACGGEVHLAREDRKAIVRAAEADENPPSDDAEEAAAEEPTLPRRKRHSSFIGLRSRR